MSRLFHKLVVGLAAVAFSFYAVGVVHAQQSSRSVPADTCVLTLDVPEGASVTADGRDYGTRRELKFPMLAPGTIYVSRILIRFPDGGQAQRIAFLRGGRRVAVAARAASRIVYCWEADDGSVGLRSIFPDGTGETEIAAGDESSNWCEPEISPDGSRISAVLAVFPEGEKSHRELWVMDIDGGNRQRLVADLGSDTPLWAPDGRGLLFTHVPGPDQAELVAIDLQGRQRRLTTDGYSADYSPDGTQIVFSRTAHEAGGRFHPELYVMNADGSGQHRILERRTFGQWSPRGDRILYEKPWDEIFTANPSGAGEVRLFSDLSMRGRPRWSPDGLHIASFRGRESSVLYVMRSDGTDSRPVTLADAMKRLLPDTAPPQIAHESEIRKFCWSPDGSQLAVIWESAEASMEGDEFGRLVVCDPEGGSIRELIPTNGRMGELQWR